MRWPSHVPGLLRRAARPADDADEEVGAPGPVLNEDGAPVIGADGRPLLKVLVTTRRDHLGFPEEQVWVDPRCSWQYTEGRDRP